AFVPVTATRVEVTDQECFRREHFLREAPDELEDGTFGFHRGEVKREHGERSEASADATTGFGAEFGKTERDEFSPGTEEHGVVRRFGRGRRDLVVVLMRREPAPQRVAGGV